MANYTYKIEDSYNCFDAHLGYQLWLYKDGKSYKTWFFDDLWFAKTRLTKKINWLRDIYGATHG